MKVAHSTYKPVEPINHDREQRITEFAIQLMKKWNKQKQNKKAPAVTEAIISNNK